MRLFKSALALFILLIAFNVYAVESVEGLRDITFTPSDGQIINIPGYFENENGGGGPFYWDPLSSETDNNGTIIKVKLFEFGRWKRSFDDNIPNLKWFGARGDGVTDDRQVLVDVDSLGFAAIYVPAGDYRLSSVYSTKTTLLLAGAKFVPDSGTWAPRQSIDTTDIGYRGYKVTYKNDYDGATDSYTYIDAAKQIELRSINFAGKQQVTGAGSRSNAAQLYLTMQHLGEGDAYNIITNAGASAHPNVELAQAWGDQNSTGFWGGQVNAITDKVNLYGFGDVALNDDSKEDVSMLGSVIFLDHTGTDSGDYNVPRMGMIIGNTGSSYIDSGLGIRGRMYTGIDLTSGKYSSGTALAIEEGDSISWDAINNEAQGKFSTQDVGITETKYDGSGLVDTVDGNDILERTKSSLTVNSDIESASILKVKGVSDTAFLTIGQIGTTSYLTSVSNDIENTSLIFRVSGGGTESNKLIISPSGTVQPGSDNYQNFGTPSARWKEVFAIAPNINTSDERLKTDIKIIDDIILDAWETVEFYQFGLTELKDGKTHFGVVAQYVMKSFSDFGLDALDYGIVKLDKWKDKETGEEKTRYGVAYSECMILEMALMRRKMSLK